MGNQYRSGIYYTDPQDLPVIETVVDEVRKGCGRELTTEVLPLTCFYEAEDYHQKYLETHPGGHCHIDLSLLKGRL